MISKIEFTTKNEAGILGKIAIALNNKGYTIAHQSVSNIGQENFTLINFSIEASHKIKLDELNYLKTDIPQIVEIHQLDSVVELDVSDLLKTYGKQLIGKHPDIRQLIQKIDNELDLIIKEQVLTKLGKGFGKWLCKNNYALGGLLSLDKTLQRMLWPSLNEFLSVNVKGNIVEVSDCPHCANQSDSVPSCFFIKGYIEGFLNALEHLPSTTVVQLSSKAMGDNLCDFEVETSKE
jgi:predicted hydrocarbon binding protein